MCIRDSDKEADQILYPAAYEEVMAVGGVSADMSPADCSVQGAGVELSAPGEYIPVLAQLGLSLIHIYLRHSFGHVFIRDLTK